MNKTLESGERKRGRPMLCKLCGKRTTKAESTVHHGFMRICHDCVPPRATSEPKSPGRPMLCKSCGKATTKDDSKIYRKRRVCLACLEREPERKAGRPMRCMSCQRETSTNESELINGARICLRCATAKLLYKTP